jgi:hypothetical protein
MMHLIPEMVECFITRTISEGQYRLTSTCGFPRHANTGPVNQIGPDDT